MPVHRNLERLEKYLTSETMWCPDDIVDYQPGGPKEGACPLCGSSIDANEWEVSFADFKYKPHGHLPTPITVNVCWSCDEAIKEHSKESMHEYKGFEPSESLKLYVLEGYLPDIAYEKTNLNNRCVFCFENLNNVYRRLFIPVGHTQEFSDNSYGGIVYACEKCSDYIGDGKPPHHVHTNLCDKCTVEYPVTKFEFDVRTDNNTHHRHLCPECFHSVFNNNNERHLQTSCAGCSKDIFIDLSQNPNYLTDLNKLLKSTKCNSCFRSIQKIYIQGDEYVRGFAHIDATNVFFTIEVRIDDIAEGIGLSHDWQVVHTSGPYDDVIEAVNAMSEYIESGNKQLSIW